MFIEYNLTALAARWRRQALRADNSNSARSEFLASPPPRDACTSFGVLDDRHIRFLKVIF